MADHPRPLSRPADPNGTRRGFFGVFRYSRRAIELVWTTSRGLTVGLALLTVFAGILPAGVAYVGALIVDAVVTAMQTHAAGTTERVIELVALEGLLVALTAGAQRGLSLCQSLLRAQLGQRVNVMILEKALTLSPTAQDARYYLAQAYLGARLPRKARENAQTLLEKQPGAAPVMTLVVLSHLMENNIPAAAEAYLQLFARAPESARKLRGQAVSSGVAAARDWPE